MAGQCRRCSVEWSPTAARLSAFDYLVRLECAHSLYPMDITSIVSYSRIRQPGDPLHGSS